MANGLLPIFPMKFFVILCLSCLAVLARDHQGINTMTPYIHTAGPSESLIDTIYQFGDSISDTGNGKVENISSLCITFPYGESYFHYATGRCSDGLLMADYYAMAFGLEFLRPYLEKDANFSNGVNFAVGGATALDMAYFVAKDIDVVGGTNSSLSVQLGWFRKHLKSICPSATGCKDKLGRSIILMEAIGGNDYSYAFENGSTFQFIAYELVPDVVRAITDVIEEMIVMGVVNLVVPSALPFGCLPYCIILSPSKHPDMYDDLGCSVYYNKIAEYHNHHLQKAIQELQMMYPNVTLIYADYYLAITRLLRKATSLGFEEDEDLMTCCGYGKNPYNFNSSTLCGSLGVPVCPLPKTRVIWDGYHLTQRSYMYVSSWMLKHTIFPALLGHASSS